MQGPAKQWRRFGRAGGHQRGSNHDQNNQNIPGSGGDSNAKPTAVGVAMKVLQILPELNAGGVERVVMVLSEFLVRQGHESIVVSNGGRLVKPLEAAGARHISLPVHRKSLASLFQIRPLRQVLKAESPDILHFHSRVPGWLAWLAWRRLPAPERPRLVSTVHGFYSVNAYSAIMTRGERNIAVSQCIADYIRTNFPSTPSNSIRLVRHGIDPDTFCADFNPAPEWLARWHRDYPQFVGKQLLLLPGRITRLKGHDDFLRLIAALRQSNPEVHGVIIGDAHPRKQAYLAELQQQVGRLDLSHNVTFIGHRADLREVMAVSRVVFSLSTSPESFGLTTLEALALGRPVVGYDHGGVGELLRDMYPDGRVPLRDAAALLATTKVILTSPRSPAPVKAPFTLETMCRAILEIYMDLLKDHSGE